MSAYGIISKLRASDNLLPSTVWSTGGLSGVVEPQTEHNLISIHHFTLSHAQQYEGLVHYLQSVFAGVVEEGRTYPQEDELTAESFEAYFFGGDVFVGVALPNGELHPDGSHFPTRNEAIASASKNWGESIAGFYYVSIPKIVNTIS